MLKRFAAVLAVFALCAGLTHGAVSKKTESKNAKPKASAASKKAAKPAVKQASNHAAKSYELALAAHRKKDLKAAITYYNAAVKADKKMWQAWLGLGICYYGMKKYNNALLIFKHVLSLKPGEPTAQKYSDMLQGKSAAARAPVKKENRTKSEIMWRSALLPGAGQFYNNETAKGYIYSLSYLAAVGGMIKYSIDREMAVSAYDNANTGFDEKFKAAQDAETRLLIPVAVAAVVWTVSVLDGFLSGEDEDNIKQGKIAAIEIFMPDPYTAAFKIASVDF